MDNLGMHIPSSAVNASRINECLPCEDISPFRSQSAAELHVPTPNEYKNINLKPPKILYYYLDALRALESLNLPKMFVDSDNANTHLDEKKMDTNLHEVSIDNDLQVSELNIESEMSKSSSVNTETLYRDAAEYKYLLQFMSYSRLVDNIQHLYSFLNKGKIFKEISEAGAMISRLRRIFRENHCVHQSTANSLSDLHETASKDDQQQDTCQPCQSCTKNDFIFDIGSGKGYSSIWASLEFPKEIQVRMLDKDSNMQLSHLQYFNNVRFHRAFLRPSTEGRKLRSKAFEEKLCDILERELTGVDKRGCIRTRKECRRFCRGACGRSNAKLSKKEELSLQNMSPSENITNISGINESNESFSPSIVVDEEIQHPIEEIVPKTSMGYIIGCHLCTWLSETFIDAFNRLPAIQGFVLSPCCHLFHAKTEYLFKNNLSTYHNIVEECFENGFMSKKLSDEFHNIEYDAENLEEKKMLVSSQYKIWTIYLFRLIEHPELCDILKIEKDEAVFSEKNYFILARKSIS